MQTLGFSGSRPYKKIYIFGDIIEVYQYEKAPYQNEEFRGEKRQKSDIDWINEWEEELNKRSLEDRVIGLTFEEMLALVRDERRRLASSITRTRNSVRRLVLANFDNNSKFITLTFAENVQELESANKEFKKFIQRMRRRYGDFKYLAVIEFQKRGAVHYHMICDLPYVKNKELAEMWRNGFVKINRIKHVDNVGAYIVKYMTKDLHDERFAGKKAYLCSKNLDRPTVVRGEVAEEIYQTLGLEKEKEVFTNSYESEYLGMVVYKEYNRKRLGSVKELGELVTVNGTGPGTGRIRS